MRCINAAAKVLNRGGDYTQSTIQYRHQHLFETKECPCFGARYAVFREGLGWKGSTANKNNTTGTAVRTVQNPVTLDIMQRLSQELPVEAAWILRQPGMVPKGVGGFRSHCV